MLNAQAGDDRPGHRGLGPAKAKSPLQTETHDDLYSLTLASLMTLAGFHLLA